MLLNILGLFENPDDKLMLTVCPRHRDEYGIRWRCSKKTCSMPVSWAKHKRNQYRGDRGLTYHQSQGLYQLTHTLIPVGTREYYNVFLYEFDIDVEHFFQCPSKWRAILALNYKLCFLNDL